MDGGDMLDKADLDSLNDKIAKREAKQKENATKEVADPTIVRLPNGLYKVAYVGQGGKIPKELEGEWTSVSKINAILERYKLSKGR